MKKITNKTILKKGENKYQPVEIDGVIYWVDPTLSIDEVYPHIVIERLTTGDYMLWQIDNINDIDRSCQYQIIAQSEQRLEGVPVISLDSYIFNFLDKACSDWYRQEYGVMANVPIRKAFIEGFNLDQRKWTDADLLKAIELAREENGWSDNSMEYTYTKEKIIEQINQTEVIHIDNQFNILSYE